MKTSPQPLFNYRRLFWTWHLYAGLCGAPLLVLIALTGAILVFAPEIDRALRPDLWTISAPSLSSPSFPISDQALVDTVRTKFPASKLLFYRQPLRADEPCQILMITPGVTGLHDAWLNPYTGELVGDRHRETSLVRIAEQLHRRLLTGEVGSSIIDLMTGWGIVLCGTGLYMWWPKTLRQFRTALTWPLRGGAYRINWRLHNALGGWFAAIILLLALTGMVFSTYTGAMFQWAMKQSGATQNPLFSPPKSQKAEGAQPISIDLLLERSKQEAAADTKFIVQFPRDAEGSFVILKHRSDRPTWDEITGFRSWSFDQYSGECLGTTSWDELGLLMKFRFLSLVIHFGSIFGLPTKILVTFACLAIPALAVSGYFIWWWKRSRKKTDHMSSPELATAASAPRAPSKWVVAALAGLCVLFPTLGVSFLVLAICQVISSRLRAA